MTKVVGVRFRQVGKIYFFAPGKYSVETGQHVIVETARGVEYGQVVLGEREVEDTAVIQPLKAIIRVAKDSGIPQSTIWSIIKKEDYEVREKNIHKICAGMGISVSEVMDPEGQQKINLSKDEIPVVIKYRKLGERDQGRVQGYVDALIEKNQDNL